MSETGNTAALAEIVSNEIFRWLKWETCSARDVDWDCNSPEHDKTTHPSDVVFYYEDPYSGQTIYVNTDLKSYKQSSITTNSVRSALKSLAMATDCALTNGNWQEKFVNCENWDVSGLLFIFNYDGSYQKDFMSLLDKISLDSLGIKRDQRIGIFGPETINYLINMVGDLRKAVQDRRKVDETSYNFYYPNMVDNKKHSLDFYSATIELILSPFMIIRFNGNKDKDYIIYYREDGDTTEEFIYLIDTLLTYQILNSENNIEVVLYNPKNDSTAMINFNSAKASYAKSWGLSANDERFQSIATRVMNTKQNYFDPLNERISNEQT